MSDQELLGTAVLELTTDQRGLVAGMAKARQTAEAETGKMQRTVTQRMDQMGRSMERTGSSMSRSLTVPILGVGVAATKMAADFDAAMERVHTQAGETQKNVERLNGEVLKLAKVSPQGPTQLADALYRLEGAGIRGEKAMKALKAASDLAAVGGANVEDTAKTLAQAYFSGIKGLGSFNHVVAELNATVGAGDLRLQQLVDALGTGILPVAKQVGLNFHDITAAMAVFGDETNNVSGWTAQLATSFHFLTNPTTKAQQAFEALGMKSDQLAQDFRKPEGLKTALTDLRDHLDRLPGGRKGEQATQLLGDILPGGRGRVLTVLLNQLDRLDKKYTQISRTNKNFGEAVAKTQQTASYKIHQSWSKIEADAVELGHTLGPTLVGIGADLADDVDKVAHAFSSLPKGTQDAILKGGLLLAGLGPALKLLGVFTTGAGKLLSAAQIVQRLSRGQAAKSAVSKVGGASTVSTMEVGEMIVRSMVGGPGGGKGPVIAPTGKGGGKLGEGASTAEEAAKGGGAALAAKLARGALGRGVRAGAIALGGQAAGDLIGGKAGRDISGAATGAGIGSIFGPVGTGVGAFAGLAASQPGSQANQDLNHLRDLKKAGATTDAQLRQLEKTIGDLKKRLARDPSGPGSNALRTEISNMQDAADKMRRSLGQTASAADHMSRKVLQSISQMSHGSSSSIHDLRSKMTYDVAVIESSFEKGSQGAKNAMGREIGAAIRNLQRSMQEGKISTKDGVTEIERLVNQHTGAAKDITQKNFAAAASAIQQAMGAGTASTKSGSALIEQYFLIAFRALGVGGKVAKDLLSAGITPSDIQNAAPKGISAPSAGRGHQNAAVGGYIAGQGLQDTVPIMAAPGEAVLNRHQQVPVEMALRAQYGIGLNDLFSRVSTPHYMAQGGKVPRVVVSGPASPLHDLVQGGLDKERKTALATIAHMFAQMAPVGGGGVGSTHGLVPQVLRAIAWAKAHGWRGSITSGFRSLAKQQQLYAQLHGKSPVAVPGTSMHERGLAIDVTDIPDFLRAMQTAPANAKLYSLVPGDPEHFSTTGHARGGFIRAARGASPRATAAAAKKKAPKGKRVKRLRVPNLPGGAYGFVRHLINKDLNSGASLSEIYGYTSQNYDLADENLLYLVQPDSYTDPSGKTVYVDQNGRPVAQGTPYIDEAAVAQRVGHLGDLLAMQTSVKARLSDALAWTNKLIPALVKGIRKRNAEIKQIRQRIDANLRQIRALEKQLRAEQRRQVKGKGAQAAKSKRINTLQDQIRGLKDENQHLGGNRDSVGTGGQLGTLLGQRQTYTDALSSARSNRTDIQGVSGHGGELADAAYTIAQITDQIGQISPDKLAQQLAQAQAQIGGDGVSSTDTQNALAELLKEQNAQLSQQLAVSQAQYKVLQGFPAFGGSFATGGIVPGPTGAARTIIAHGGERITPVGGSGQVVQVIVKDGAVDLRKIEVIAEGAAVKVSRQQSRAAGRALPGAGGGLSR